jgi:hypothetical protein
MIKIRAIEDREILSKHYVFVAVYKLAVFNSAEWRLLTGLLALPLRLEALMPRLDR